METTDETLMEMDTEYNEKLDKMPNKGAMCVTRNHIDSSYYRSVVLDIMSNCNTSINSEKYSTDVKFKVLYIDFGNVETVTMSNITVTVPCRYRYRYRYRI